MRYPYYCSYGFAGAWTYQQGIPGTWVGMQDHALHSVQVDLSLVPGTDNTYLWRIGARRDDASASVGCGLATLPRSYPSGTNDGWVWSGLSYFSYETGRFADVPTLHWAYCEIEACAEAGIVGGYPDGSYQPTNPVTRDQMAVYISRALAGGDTNVPPGPTDASFDDVPTDHWACKYVEYCVAQGVAQGFDPTHYQPDLTVTRDQMAVYIARAFQLPL